MGGNLELICKVGAETKEIKVDKEDQINVLFKKLGLSDRMSKMLYNGKTFNIATTLTFKEVGFNGDSEMIFIINESIAT